MGLAGVSISAFVGTPGSKAVAADAERSQQPQIPAASPAELQIEQNRAAHQRNRQFATGATPLPLDFSKMSNDQVRAARESVRRQLNGDPRATALVRPLDVGGKWALQAWQDTSKEMKTRHLGDDPTSKGRPVVDTFPLMNVGQPDGLQQGKTLYSTLVAQHDSRFHTTTPNMDTWLGQALSVTKSNVQYWWSKQGIDARQASLDLEHATLRSRDAK
jgi:hypothetical protein